MGRARNGRILGAALAMSLAFHLVLATFVRMHPVEATTYRATPVVIIHIWVRPKPTPRPPPQPQRPVQHVVQTVRPRVRPPHVRPQPNGDVAVVLPLPTGEPSAPGNTGKTGNGGTNGPPFEPSSPPAPACSDPNVEATTLMAVSPDGATSGEAGTSATAMIKVDLDSAGRVTGVSVYRSAGSLELDRAAMEAARASTYTPEMRDCQPVSGSYLFKVEFSN